MCSWGLLAGTVFVATAFGQTLVETERIPSVKRSFDPGLTGPQFRCEIRPVRATLDFGFRFSSGYRVEIPLSNFLGSGHRLDISLRVTPQGREAVYLAQTGALSKGPETKGTAEIAGTFLVGEGTYDAEVLVQDELHRSCRGGWQIQARRTGNERQMIPAIPDGSVEDIAASAVLPDAKSGPQIARLTILLHAAPLSPNRSKLEPGDIQLLMDSLSSLMRELPAQAVRLVAFNLDQRAVVFRKEGFEADQNDELQTALSHMKLGMVDYRALRQGPIDVLAGLLQAELANAEPADAVIILGPRSRPVRDLAKDAAATAVARRAGVDTPIFALQFLSARQLPIQGRPNPRLGSAQQRTNGPLSDTDPSRIYGTAADGTPLGGPEVLQLGETADSIQRLISHIKGETISIRGPHDLADAIRRIEPRISKAAMLPVKPPAAAPVKPPVKEAPHIALPAAVPPASDAGTAVVSESSKAPLVAAETNAGKTDNNREVTADEDPVDVLMQLRDQVVERGQRIPNHTCVETIRRDRYESTTGGATKSCDALLAVRKEANFQERLKLESTDWLRLDVAFSSTGEIFSWAGANKFEEGDIDELIPEGAIGTGAFASLVLSIFGRHDQRFVFEGETTVEGKPVFEYSFVVPRDRSRYRFKTRKVWMITGYSGTLMIDPKTAALVRVLIRTDELAPSTDSCVTDTTLEYSLVRLEGDDYLLPKLARQRFIGRNGHEAENQMTFAGCRQYQSESKVVFDEHTPAGSGQESNSAAGLVLPAGLPVIVELRTAVRMGSAAAGDEIEGRLVKPIRDGQQKVVVDEGALVRGRLMRVETSYAGREQDTVALRWEAIKLDGAMIPFNLTPNRRVEHQAVSGPKTLKRRGMEIQLPLPSEGRYAVVHLAEGHRLLESGYQSEWLTSKP